MSMRQEAMIKELQKRLDEQEEVTDLLLKRVEELEQQRKQKKRSVDG